jgi:hypothetical protein
MKTLIVAILFLFVLNWQYTFAGEIVTWEDEKGVTHIEIKGSTQNDSYKKRTKPRNNNQYKRSTPIKKLSLDYEKKQRAMQLELEREREERKLEYEKKARERELDRAKKNYEFYKSKEDTYRTYYLDATSDHYRNYWYEKWQKAKEEQSKYYQLLNKK